MHPFFHNTKVAFVFCLVLVTMDVGIWFAASLLTVPCVFIKETKWCCAKCCAMCQKKEDEDTDPDHRMKLSDLTADPEAGRTGSGANQNSGGKRVLSIVLRVLLCLLIGYIIAMVILAIYIAAFGPSLVYEPESDADCVAGCTELTCCDYSTSLVSYTSVDFESNGATLNGWYMETASGVGLTPRVKVLYNHGSGKNVAVRYRVERYAFLLTLGVQLFAYDYPGYGASTGDPSEDDIYASSKAAYDVLQTRAGGDPSNTVILGRSLGGAVAVNLATQILNSTQSSGMVLQSTFTSLAEAAGVGMPILGWWVSAIFPERFPSIDRIGEYTNCLYSAHSKEDEFVPLDLGRELYDAATNVPSSCKVFVEMPNSKHDDPMTQEEKDVLTSWINARRPGP